MSHSETPVSSDVLQAVASEASEAVGRVEGRDGVATLEQLEHDRERLLDQAERALEQRDVAGLVILDSLRWNARLFGPMSRYAPLVKRGIGLAREAGGATGAAFLAFAASIRADSADDLARRAIEMADEEGSPALQVRARLALAVCSVDDEPPADALLHESNEICEREGLHFEQAQVLEATGFHRLTRGKIADGESLLRRAIDGYHAYANEVFTVDAQRGLGWAAFRRGRLRAAASRFEATLEIASRHGLRSRAAGCAFDLGILDHALGDLDGATTHLRSALEVFEAAGQDSLAAACWIELARLAWSRGRPESALDGLTKARAAALRASDEHVRGRALAQGATFRWNDGDDDALFDALESIDADRDPVAAIDCLVSIVGIRAVRGEFALRELNRAEEIAACLPEADRFRDAVAGRLLTIGQTFALLADVRAAPGTIAAIEAWRAARDRLATLRLPDDPADLLQLETDFSVRLLRQRAGELLAALDADQEADAAFDHLVEFHPNCHWVRIDDDDPIQLASKNQLRLLVKALAKRHFANANGAVSVEELLESCWPGEYVSKEAGRSRIYTAVRALRQMGLGDIIVTGDEGYRLVSGVHFRVAPHTGIVSPR